MTAVMSTFTFQRMSRALLAAACLAAVLGAADPAAARSFRTGVIDPSERGFGEVDPDGAFAAARGAGMSVVRVPVVWSDVAPTAPKDATSPIDAAYGFPPVDAVVLRTLAAGMQPLLSVYSAPRWARVKGPSPNPGDVGAFMTALARRYAGVLARPRDGMVLPRVRLFQLWNEPNIRDYLDQGDGAAHYRQMMLAAHPAVHSVHEDNLLVAGGLGPFAGPGGRYGVHPLSFMREVLSEDVPVDVWSVHPYTSGPPARRAGSRGDVSVGDLPEVRRILRRTGHGRVPLWITEFGWDSAPPDPKAVPVREHARWVDEAMYRMWRQGVRVLIWFQMRDNPKGTFTWEQTYQAGLYYRTTPNYADEKAKPALRAFRFPFVALPSGRGIVLWGRTPGSRAGRVVVERRIGRRWRRVTSLRADGDGIFRGRLSRRRPQVLRARSGGETSLGFAPRRTKMRFVNPFGGDALPPDPE
jgi:hypothetical protein